MPYLKLDNLSKTYTQRDGGAVEAVRGVSLALDKGACAAITGASGSGKTTLLMMLAGLVEPTDGTITLSGRVLNRVRPDERNIAMLFQHDALYPHLSARKHLVLSLRSEGVARSEMNARVERIADELGITECLGRRPSALSGGQRRRVALARALVRRADLIVLDEPLSGVDDETSERIRRVLKDQWAQSGITAIVVTHDAQTAAELGDQVLTMHNGHLEHPADDQ